jgi:hypothetical protein
MKKLLGIVVLGLLLSGNANAGILKGELLSLIALSNIDQILFLISVKSS